MKYLFVLSLILLNLNGLEIYSTFDVEAIKKANLAFSSSGIVKDIYVDVGSVVKKNQELANLDNEDLKSLLEVSQNTLKYAKSDFERQKLIKNIIDKEKFDSYAYKYENAKANLRYQQSLLEKTYLKAPFDGIIVSKNVESGDVVSGQITKTLFEIQSIGDVKLLLSFDSKYWDKIKVGDIFKYSIDGKDEKYESKITKIYPVVDNKTRKLKAEVITKDIPVGLFGTGYIIAE